MQRLNWETLSGMLHTYNVITWTNTYGIVLYLPCGNDVINNEYVKGTDRSYDQRPERKVTKGERYKGVLHMCIV